MASSPVLPRVPGFAYGGDYNPEQWEPAVWREDARLMREAGVNFVSVGIFSWAHLEPRPGRYEFGWLDRVLDLLASAGVRACLATATASPPPWLARLHPSSGAVARDGGTMFPGSRQHHSPFSPDYRRRAAALTERLAARYARHPALAAWHVDNEFSCHQQECHSPAATRAFRAWLRRRYGTLARLNDAWTTSFWSQRYGAWDEVWTPRRAPYHNNPAQELDYARFWDELLLDLYLSLRAILRRRTPDVPVTTNFMWPFRPLDYRKWAEHVDFVAWDSYPDPHGAAAETAAFGHDVMRSLTPGKPFVLMEQATTQVNWRAANGLKRPGEMRALSLQAVARGADGVMFFQWRQSRGGAEKFHSAMVPHGGARADSRVWREVTGLGADLTRLSPVLGSAVAARAAIVMDWENWWALELPSKPARIDYAATLADFHRLCFRRNVAVDFVHPGQDLSGYAVAFAPSLHLLRETDARNLTQWVRAGGRLAVGPFSGVVDANDRVVLGGYPALLRATLGLVVEEWDGLAPGATRRVRLPGGRATHGSVLAEVVRLEGATAVATFAEDFYAGRAAATRHRCGRGEAWYLATRFDDAALDRLLGGLLPAGPAAPAGVEVRVRRAGARAFVFVLNHTRAAVTVRAPAEAAGGRDLLGGKKVGRRLRLEPFGVAVIAAQSAPG